MAFENIGLGGVLSFDSSGAVSSMSVAERAFGSLGGAANRVVHSVGRIGAGLSSFQLMGGLGVAGIVAGFHSLVETGMEWNKYVEMTRISIGTITAAVTKTPLADNIKNADKILEHLNVVATQTHVETSQVVDSFSMLVGPLLGAGASMKDIYEYTKSTTIMASALHQPVNRATLSIAKLAGGVMMSRDRTIGLLQQMHLLTETSQQWAAYLPEQRLKRMKEIFATFNASGEYLQHTWEAQASSAKSFFKIMAGRFTKGMFSQGNDALSKFNQAFMDNQDEWLEKLEKFGNVFASIITWMKNEAMSFYGRIQTVISWIQDKLDYFDDDRLPGIGKVVAHIVAQFMLMATAMSPIISVVGFIVGKVMALWEIAMGLLGVLSALAVPLLIVGAIAGAVFLLFRREGEGVAEFLGRAFNYVKEIVLGLWDSIMEVVNSLSGTFAQAEKTAQDFWAGIQPGLQEFREGVEGLVDLFMQLWHESAIVIGKVITAVGKIIEGLRPGLEVIFNGIMEVFNAAVESVNYLFPKIMAVLEPIFDVIASIAVKIAQVVGKLVSLMRPGFDAIAWIVRDVIMPAAGWLIDTFGPIIVTIFQMVGAVLGKIGDFIMWMVDGIKMLEGVLKDGVLWAMDKLGISAGDVAAVGDHVKQIFIDIGKQIADMVSGPLKDFYDISTAGASALFGFIKDTSIIGIVQGVKDLTEDANQSSFNYFDMIATQLQIAKLAAMSTSELITFIAQNLAKMYEEYAKPIVDAGLSIVQSFTGLMDIKTTQPVVKIDNTLNLNATMCVNGRNLAVAQTAYTAEVGERSGYTNDPYQTQRVQISGVRPTG